MVAAILIIKEDTLKFVRIDFSMVYDGRDESKRENHVDIQTELPVTFGYTSCVEEATTTNEAYVVGDIVEEEREGGGREIERYLQFEDTIGSIYRLTFPRDFIFPIVENLKAIHCYSNKKFLYPPGYSKDGFLCTYMRLMFSDPEINSKYQVLFKYDTRLTPVPLAKEFFRESMKIRFEKFFQKEIA